MKRRSPPTMSSVPLRGPDAAGAAPESSEDSSSRGGGAPAQRIGNRLVRPWAM
jgi:hypothetical protein